MKTKWMSHVHPNSLKTSSTMQVDLRTNLLSISLFLHAFGTYSPLIHVRVSYIYDDDLRYSPVIKRNPGHLRVSRLISYDKAQDKSCPLV
jgi:hypothetical protein